MEDFAVRIRRNLKFTFYFLSLSLLAYAFTQYKLQFAGLTLGASISLFNSIYTARKVVQFGDIVISKLKKKSSLGTATRMATSVLAVIVAMRYPETFDLIYTVIGLFVAQVIALLDGIYLHIKSS